MTTNDMSEQQHCIQCGHVPILNRPAAGELTASNEPIDTGSRTSILEQSIKSEYGV
jgi:hypothetical protein